MKCKCGKKAIAFYKGEEVCDFCWEKKKSKRGREGTNMEIYYQRFLEFKDKHSLMCDHCKKSFPSTKKNKKYCSRECAREVANEMREAWTRMYRRKKQ